MENNGFSGILPHRNPDSTAIRLLLFSAAFIWFTVGLGISLGHSASAEFIGGAWHLGVPESFRVLQWWGASFLTLLVVATNSHPRLNMAAVGMLMLGPAIRVSSYLGAWLLHLIPGGSPGYDGGWYWAAIHLGMCLVVVVIALLLRTGNSGR